MKISKYMVLLLFVASCNAPTAVYDYDQKINFQNYSSYAFFPEFRTGLSQLDESRLMTSLESQLSAKGLSQSENAGIYVNVYTEEYQQDNRSRIGVGLGGGGRNGGVGVSGGIPIGQMDSYLRLTFDFIDKENDALIWQAVVDSPFNFNAEPALRQERFDKIVAKALEGYPPE